VCGASQEDTHRREGLALNLPTGVLMELRLIQHRIGEQRRIICYFARHFPCPCFVFGACQRLQRIKVSCLPTRPNHLVDSGLLHPNHRSNTMGQTHTSANTSAPGPSASSLHDDLVIYRYGDRNAILPRCSTYEVRLSCHNLLGSAHRL
jgi:hypothetical protein